MQKAESLRIETERGRRQPHDNDSLTVPFVAQLTTGRESNKGQGGRGEVLSHTALRCGRGTTDNAFSSATPLRIKDTLISLISLILKGVAEEKN